MAVRPAYHMSLDFQFPETIDRSLIEYQRDDQTFWHPRAESLVWYMMILQHDTDGEMTDDKLLEIARRIALIDLIHGDNAHYWVDKVGYRIQLHDIITYWGLTTNVSHLTRSKWDAYWHKCITGRRNADEKQDIIKRLSVRRPMHDA
jgi:hypothetical protein